MGDAILVYFGDPQTHPDDAEPSVRAGRELTGAASALRSTVPLQASVGRATAPIIVGDPIGTGAAQKRAVVGEAPKLAARLQGLSGPTKSSLPMAREDPSTDRARGPEEELQLPSLAVPSRTAVKARWGYRLARLASANRGSRPSVGAYCLRSAQALAALLLTATYEQRASSNHRPVEIETLRPTDRFLPLETGAQLDERPAAARQPERRPRARPA
jgi:hypothetical protein